MLFTNPREFAAWFNEKYTHAYRRITTKDANDMTVCGLIGRYGFYVRDDLETIRGILEYEQLREKRSKQKSAEDKLEPPKCRMCCQPLPPQPEGKKGRPKEYCTSCESSRGMERYRKSRRRRQAVLC